MREYAPSGLSTRLFTLSASNTERIWLVSVSEMTGSMTGTPSSTRRSKLRPIQSALEI